jgi:hypothetical protein
MYAMACRSSGHRGHWLPRRRRVLWGFRVSVGDGTSISEGLAQEISVTGQCGCLIYISNLRASSIYEVVWSVEENLDEVAKVRRSALILSPGGLGHLSIRTFCGLLRCWM